MENINPKEVIERYDFLYLEDSKNIFSIIDFNLRRGTHIQRKYPKQEPLFNFIESNYHGLKRYYKDLFNLSLRSSSDIGEKFYFITLDKETKSTEQNKKNILKAESIIIGILLYKIYYLDGNIELSSLEDFKNIIDNEYEEYKPHLYRLLLGNINIQNNYSDNDEKNIDNKFERAFKDFKNLGWIYREKTDYFEIMPSFGHLRELYSDYIHDIELLMRDSK